MIIWINGPINSGKSTIAKLLATRKIENPAVIEIDYLREFISGTSLEVAIPINLENSSLLIRNFYKHKFNVIDPYPLSKRNFDFIDCELRDLEEKIKYFTLNPRIEVALSNRGRTLDTWKLDRIKHHYEIGINNPEFGTIIDNSDMSPENTANKIFELIQNVKG